MRPRVRLPRQHHLARVRIDSHILFSFYSLASQRNEEFNAELGVRGVEVA
jgi:hypothetical protein